MREKKSGALSRVQKLKKRLSHSFGRLCKYSRNFKKWSRTSPALSRMSGPNYPMHGVAERGEARLRRVFGTARLISRNAPH